MSDTGLTSISAELPATVETAASAVAAREKAAIEARYVMALKRPRDMDEVRVRLLKECDRPGFAEVAKYEKPVAGQKIVGLSVRFAEAAIRLAGNILTQVLIVFDDRERRIPRARGTVGRRSADRRSCHPIRVTRRSRSRSGRSRGGRSAPSGPRRWSMSKRTGQAAGGRHLLDEKLGSA